MIRIFLSFLVVLLCSGCDSVKSVMGFDHKGPDEFDVLPLAPLSQPKDYNNTPKRSPLADSRTVPSNAANNSWQASKPILYKESSPEADRGAQSTAQMLLTAQTGNASHISKSVFNDDEARASLSAPTGSIEDWHEKQPLPPGTIIDQQIEDGSLKEKMKTQDKNATDIDPIFIVQTSFENPENKRLTQPAALWERQETQSEMGKASSFDPYFPHRKPRKKKKMSDLRWQTVRVSQVEEDNADASSPTNNYGIQEESTPFVKILDEEPAWNRSLKTLTTGMRPIMGMSPTAAKSSRRKTLGSRCRISPSKTRLKSKRRRVRKVAARIGHPRRVARKNVRRRRRPTTVIRRKTAVTPIVAS